MSVDILRDMASDKDPEVAAEAVRSLERLGDKVGTDVWAGLAEARGATKAVRLSSLTELAGRKGPGLVPLYVRALKDPDTEISRKAAEGLKALGPDALPALHKLLGDDKLRLTAIKVIGNIGDGSSGKELISALPGMDGRERLASVEALGRLGGAGSLEALAGLYREGRPDIMTAVVKALAGMKLAGSEPMLAEVLTDAMASPDDGLRFYAVRAAGSLRVKAMRGVIQARMGVEKSQIIKDELARALEGMPMD
jgi:HEAT repeat protein